MRVTIRMIVAGMLALAGCNNKQTAGKPISWETGADYPVYGGNKAGTRYSPLDQINLTNVSKLDTAWMYFAADTSGTAGGARKRMKEMQCQPIVVNGILYGTTPELGLFALEAATGKEVWKFDPAVNNKNLKYTSNRGVVYWEDDLDKRILYSAGAYLYAIDAATGRPVTGFGRQGSVDLHEGLQTGLAHDVSLLSVTATSPGVVYKDIYITGSSVAETGDAAPGHVRGFDVRTGALRWTFHTIPQPGEPGYETWPPGAYKKFGGVNNWSGLVVDEKRGLVFFGTGSPSEDFYGGDRKGMNLFSDCIIALDASTGKMRWYFQTVHHDLWDLDLPCPPILATVTQGGKKVDAVVQATKNGLVYVLDRERGSSLFPVEEEPVPAGALPGEHPWPTQPHPVKPLPFTRHLLTQGDLTTISATANGYATALFTRMRSGHRYIPPGLTGSANFTFSGGATWGGGAVDPEGILYLNSNNLPVYMAMNSKAERDRRIAASTSVGNTLYLVNCATCHGAERKGGGTEFPALTNIDKRLTQEDILSILKTGRARMPSFQHLAEADRNAIAQFLLHPGTADGGRPVSKPGKKEQPVAGAGEQAFPYQPPYFQGERKWFTDQEGYPAIKPPWGTLNAIDLNSGNYLWQVPLGEYTALTKRGIAPTGTPNFGGPLATAGGLVFIASTEDEKFRAFDKKTGKVVWQYQLPAGGFATPVTYQADGRQYVAIAAGGVRQGLKPGGWYIAFALK